MALTRLDTQMFQQPANISAANIQTFGLSTTDLYTKNIINNTSVFGNLTIYGTLTALSSVIVNVNSATTNASALSVVNTLGQGIALYVSQGPSTQRVASFVGAGSEILRINNTDPDLGLPGVVINQPPTGPSLSAKGISRFDSINASNINIDTFIIPSLTSTNLYTENIRLPQGGGGGIYNNALFYGNLTVYGGITALSGITTTNTGVTKTSSLSVANTGPGPALYVSQTQHIRGIANFTEGDGTIVVKINNSGLDLPAVSVNGTLSTNIHGTTENWYNAYTNIQNNAGNWNNVYSTVQSNSASQWDLQSTVNYLSTQNVLVSSLTVTNKISGTLYGNIYGDRNVYGSLSASGSGRFGGLTVSGDISSTGRVFTSGGPVVVSSSTLETPTTGISAISNIVALTQLTYNSLTIKNPSTLYLIVSA